MICPHCGGTIITAGSGDWTALQSFQSAYPAIPGNAGTAQPAFTGNYERRQPARTPELIGDVAVPATQAIITAGAGAIAGGAIGGWQGAAIGGGVVGIITWFVLLGEHRRGLWIIERITGRDLDGDGHTGQGQPAPPVRVELHEDNSRRIRIIDLPVSDDKLQTLASAILEDNRPFNRRELTRDILTETEYRDLQTAMISAGLLVMRGKTLNAGIELSHSGRAILKKMLSHRVGS